jgi:hypothetical protein
LRTVFRAGKIVWLVRELNYNRLRRQEKISSYGTFFGRLFRQRAALVVLQISAWKSEQQPLG